MKVLLINGSPRKNGCTYTALKEVADAIEKHGIETEIYHIGAKPMAGCLSCRSCRKTGKCIIDDDVNTFAQRFASGEFDGLVVGSPVYFASPTGPLLSFLDRLFYSSQKNMYGLPGACVVSCRRGGATASFDDLNRYFGIANMLTVGSQYWNQVHGNTPEEVVQDEEGMQTMRALGENMAWIIKCLKAAKEAGVPDPVYEARVSTNYIR